MTSDHSFGLALTCWFLVPRIAPELDMTKIFAYALAHDTVEVHAGDTFIFDKTNAVSKSDREDAAIEQLRQDWSDFLELANAAADYKNKIDDEAKFVYSVDKMLPVLMVNLGEKAIFWERHKITNQMMQDNKKTDMSVSSHVVPYFDELVEWSLILTIITLISHNSQSQGD